MHFVLPAIVRPFRASFPINSSFSADFGLCRVSEGREDPRARNVIAQMGNVFRDLFLSPRIFFFPIYLNSSFVTS